MDHAQAKLRLTDVMTRLTAYFGKHLPDDVLKRLTELKAEQKKRAFDARIRNHVSGFDPCQ